MHTMHSMKSENALLMGKTNRNAPCHSSSIDIECFVIYCRDLYFFTLITSPID